MESKVEALWHTMRAIASDSKASLPKLHSTHSNFDNMKKFPLVCVIDGEGMFCYLCDRLRKLIRVPSTVIGTYIGRLLDVKSAVEVMKVIESLKESKDGRVAEIPCFWQSLMTLDDAIEDCEWNLCESSTQSLFLLIGFHYSMSKSQKYRFIQTTRKQFGYLKNNHSNLESTPPDRNIPILSPTWSTLSTTFSTVSSSLGNGGLDSNASSQSLPTLKRKSSADFDFNQLQHLFGTENSPVCFFDPSGLIFFVNREFFGLFRSAGPNIGNFLTSSSYSAIRRQCAEWGQSSGLTPAGCQWLDSVKRSTAASEEYDWYLSHINSFFVLYGR